MVIADTPSQVSANLARAAALAVALTPTAGWSLTPEEVWGKLQELVSESGQTVEVASEQSSPGTLQMDGVTFKSAPEVDGSATMLIGNLTFTSQDDGSVQISRTGRYQMVIDYGAGSNVERTVVEIADTGVGMSASGSVEDMTLTYAAETLEVRLVDIETADASLIPEVTFTATGLRSETLYGSAENTVNGSLETLKVDIAIAERVNDSLELTYQMSDVALSSTVPSGGLASIGQGPISFDTALKYGGFSLGAAIASPAANGTLALSGGSGETLGTSSDGLVSVDVKTTDVDFDLRALGLPGPIAWTADQFDFRVSGPLTWSINGMGLDASGQSTPPGDGEFPFTVGIQLEDMTLASETWDIFDPNGVLPRDPARLVLDLNGTGEINDRIAPGDTVSTPTLEPNAITINNLSLRLAGATLDGEGDLELLNDQPGAMPGMPGIVGKVSLSMFGLDEFLQGLTEIGLMDSQSLAGARMMLGVLTKSGGVRGALVSDIEFAPFGGVIANGMRLR